MPLSLFSQPPVGLEGRTLPGCCFPEDVPEALSVAVSTCKGPWVEFSHPVALSVLKGSGPRAPIRGKLPPCCRTCSVSRSPSRRRLAGGRMSWQERDGRLSSLPPLPSPALFSPCRLSAPLQLSGTWPGDTSPGGAQSCTPSSPLEEGRLLVAFCSRVLGVGFGR